MNKVYFIFGCHCHQPVGNFDEVVERVYQDAYLPFLEAVHRHPSLKVVLHYSGILLDWIKAKHPEFLELLQALVRRGQVEMLTGSYYEAILPVIPERELKEQIQRLTSLVEGDFQTSPRGMWLAERVWEPKLARSLPGAGVEFALVDDYHFKAAGLDEKQLLGYFKVEEEGSYFFLFPISEKLRYLTPFERVEETFSYLRQMGEIKENPLLVIVDDGEKYGSWPGTKKWVHEEGWLEAFFSALEKNQTWVETVTCSEYLQKFRPEGLVYLPVSSYFNMGEWSLPADRAAEYLGLVEKLKGEGVLEKYKGFLRGGIWRNFFFKYPESNQMHKKMLTLSRSLTGLEEKAGCDPEKSLLLARARDCLLRSQCNDGYWHGVFGGVYLPHLRDALYKNLIQGERLLDRAAHPGEKGWCDIEVTDCDGDGQDELILSTAWLKAYFDPEEGGALVELDYKPKNFNLINTLARRFEHYHLNFAQSRKESGEKDRGQVSIHDLQRENPLPGGALAYDKYRRASLIDHIFEKSPELESLRAADDLELADFAGNPYEFRIEKNRISARVIQKRHSPFLKGGLFPLEIVKEVQIQYNDASLAIEYEIINHSSGRLEFCFAVEFNFSLLAGNHPGVKLSFPGQGEDYLMASSGVRGAAKEIKIINNLEKFSLSLSLEKAATLSWFPVETVSQSERGSDLTYQSTVLLPCWEVSLPEGGRWEVKMSLAILSSQDPSLRQES